MAHSQELGPTCTLSHPSKTFDGPGLGMGSSDVFLVNPSPGP